ncbi:peptidoglycan-associated lipoprotein Pal [Loktanella sp. F6476L]|uniref:peptidoglycan-associated lipoprotein Pal n=1 Tax=Loktanella sp. F6476L TaxID=2926405 RepID=UPI001FF1A22E|nr:peptidoglycan-associated lipoprotein Pal [Loktanella sp. F6476L]MCK0120164.1 peptidoglycan-associated lipoprotein Pal [Loktanella sp. F6476L]
MVFLKKAALATLILATAACTNPDRFGGSGGADAGAGAGANTGAPLVAPVAPTGANDPQSPLYFTQTIGDRVLFVVDSSTLTAAGQQTLNGQANWLKTNADYQAIIEGHADEQGTREYNLALGNRRANAVREYLVSQGVPSTRLRVISYGKERPIEVCASEACYSQNRRAVTVIAAGGTS